MSSDRQDVDKYVSESGVMGKIVELTFDIRRSNTVHGDES